MIVDASNCDTTPGSGSLFAAPQDCASTEDYERFIRGLWNGGSWQHIALLGKDLAEPGRRAAVPRRFAGPYVQSLKRFAYRAYTKN